VQLRGLSRRSKPKAATKSASSSRDKRSKVRLPKSKPSKHSEFNRATTDTTKSQASSSRDKNSAVKSAKPKSSTHSEFNRSTTGATKSQVSSSREKISTVTSPKPKSSNHSGLNRSQSEADQSQRSSSRDSHSKARSTKTKKSNHSALNRSKTKAAKSQSSSSRDKRSKGSKGSSPKLKPSNRSELNGSETKGAKSRASSSRDIPLEVKSSKSEHSALNGSRPNASRAPVSSGHGKSFKMELPTSKPSEHSESRLDSLFKLKSQKLEPTYDAQLNLSKPPSSNQDYTSILMPSETPSQVTGYPSIQPSLETPSQHMGYPTPAASVAPILHAKTESPSMGHLTMPYHATGVPTPSPSVQRSEESTLQEVTTLHPSSFPTLLTLPTLGVTNHTRSPTSATESPAKDLVRPVLMLDLDGLIAVCHCDSLNDCINRPIVQGTTLRICSFVNGTTPMNITPSVENLEIEAVGYDKRFQVIANGTKVSNDVEEGCESQLQACTITTPVDEIFLLPEMPPKIIVTGAVVAVSGNGAWIAASIPFETVIEMQKLTTFDTWNGAADTGGSSSFSFRKFSLVFAIYISLVGVVVFLWSCLRRRFHSSADTVAQESYDFDDD
jgi:hypothetical protein